MNTPSELKEIDRAVDLAIPDRARAERLKDALHRQYDLTRPVQGRAGRYEAEDDAEDLWDNVPV